MQNRKILRVDVVQTRAPLLVAGPPQNLEAPVVAVPGRRGISTNATPPWNGNDRSFEILGRPSDQQRSARLNYVNSEYFSVLHIPLLAGRLWDRPEPMRGARLCVVNQAFARQYWPQGNPIGKQLRFPDLQGEPPYLQAVPDSDNWMQVIGVVADARDDGLRKPVRPAVYVPFSLVVRVWTQILVRTHRAPLAALNRVRAAVKAVDPDQQVFWPHARPPAVDRAHAG